MSSSTTIEADPEYIPREAMARLARSSHRCRESAPVHLSPQTGRCPQAKRVGRARSEETTSPSRRGGGGSARATDLSMGRSSRDCWTRVGRRSPGRGKAVRPTKRQARSGSAALSTTRWMPMLRLASHSLVSCASHAQSAPIKMTADVTCKHRSSIRAIGCPIAPQASS